MTKWLSTHDYCDLCHDELDSSHVPWFVDGRTKFGVWALMCPECFYITGTGLGLGSGQKYDAKTCEKIEG